MGLPHQKPDARRLIRHLAPFIGLGLFTLAAVVLYHQLHQYPLHEVMARIKAMRTAQIWAALALTVCSYLVMTGYDLLALRYIQHPVPVPKTMLASFLGYAFSNNIGFSMLAGASIRYRLYSAWGLSAVEITQLVVFCTTSILLGFAILSGAVFLFEPLMLPQSLHWPLATVRPLGFVLMVAAGIYLAATIVIKKGISFKSWHFSLPSWHLAGAQMSVASVDWLLAGSVLYCLLPDKAPIGFSHFLEIFLLAQLGGLISQVPGGLGVFESIILLLAPGQMSAPQWIGALIVYRGIYYLLPLIVAMVALGIEELLQRHALLERIQTLAGAGLETLFIPLLSLAVFVAGAILLFSGALPSIPHRLVFLDRDLPLPVVEISHFVGSLAGMGLLLLARSLQRRLDAAYLLTVALLAVGIATLLLKGADYEESLILALVLLVLLPRRSKFPRRASLLSVEFNAGWLAAIAVVLISSTWLGLFAYRHVEYSNDLWWHFSTKAAAPRFMRAMVGSLALALAFALARLLRPAPYRSANEEKPLPDEVPAIVARSPSSAANLALLGDKQFLFEEEGRAFIMYGRAGETWVAMGDPVGPVEMWPELLWRFRQMADRYGDRVVFYEVGHEHLYLYLDMGLSLLKLGEEARVPLTSFSLEGSGRKHLRYSHRKLANQGCRFEIIEADAVPPYMDELRAISDAWLSEKNTREKGFSLGFFDPAYVRRFPLGLVRMEDRILAFANLWVSNANEELTVDLMRHLPDAPNGVMDYLFIELMLWGASRGYHWFNLGMAPFSGLENQKLAPLWHRIGTLVVRFGDHFYNFQGLRAYKEKFGPVWQPKYLATPGGLSLPRTLADIGALISGGLKGVLFK
ncbi:MAG: bifunctional lysylphosphatidylglycerol flippase/synthetase MprF [Desulfosarcinaceae bacterium]